MATLDRPEVGYRTPVDLVAEVRRGRMRIPQFQRAFKWESGDVIELFDSIVRGYPIGNLLLWRQPAPAAHVQVGPVQVDAPDTASALWVVDGQQRITSLVGALVAAEETTDPRFRIYLDLDSGSFRSIGVRQQPDASWVAVSRLLDTTTLLRWMRENSGWLSDEQVAVADQAAKAVREYQIPTYVVSSPDEASLVEIFRRMNDTGKPLSRAEVFHALHSGLSGDEPADLPSLGSVTAQVGFGSLDDRLVLRCVLAFRGGDIFREDFRDEFTSDADRIETFREVAGTLREAVAFLTGEAGIPHVRLLPYSHVLPILVRFVRVHGAPSGRTAALLRRWVWRGGIAGTRAHGISVVDIRHQVLAADAADPMDAAQALLRQVPSFPDVDAELDKVNFNHAMTKINVLGLLSAEPRDPRTGQPVDIGRLVEAGSPLRSIVNDGPNPLAQSLANRIVTDVGSGRTLQRALGTAGPELAATHLIDDQAYVLLVTLQLDRFLARRESAVRIAVKRHIDRMAEWGARDGRSVADVIRSVA
jgi:hypothetical protein